MRRGCTIKSTTLQPNTKDKNNPRMTPSDPDFMSNRGSFSGSQTPSSPSRLSARVLIPFTLFALALGVIAAPTQLLTPVYRALGSDSLDMGGVIGSYEYKGNITTMVNVSNAFGFSLFANLSKNDSAISPPSIASALSLVAAGATGTAANEFKALLPQDVILPSSPMDKTVEIQSGAAAWLEDNVKESFRRATRANGAEIRPLPRSADEVNAWVSDVTKGRIEDLLSELPGGLSALLVTAIFFKAEWTTQFDPRNTIDSNFKIGDGNVVPIRMMTLRDTKFPYARVTIPDEEKNMNVDVIDLPYGENGEFAATFVVTPDDELGVNKIVKALGEQGTTLWDDWVAELRPMKIDRLGLPRFKLDYGPQSLANTIMNLGLKAPFTPSVNDPPLLGILDDPSLIISDIIHKATVEVTEEGTVASAATAIILTRSLPQITTTVVMNRPFLFAIRNTSTGQILFLGRVDRPVNPKEN